MKLKKKTKKALIFILIVNFIIELIILVFSFIITNNSLSFLISYCKDFLFL